MRFNSPFGDCQSESCASGVACTSFVDPIEAVEDAFRFVFWDSRPLIRNRDSNRIVPDRKRSPSDRLRRIVLPAGEYLTALSSRLITAIRRKLRSAETLSWLCPQQGSSVSCPRPERLRPRPILEPGR